MTQNSKKAILLIHHGTVDRESKEKSLDAINQDVQLAFPDHHIYTAWIRKMTPEEAVKWKHLYIPNVEEALKNMLSDGITEVLIQPTLITNGRGYKAIKQVVCKYQNYFSKIQLGSPLLSETQDYEKLMQAICDEFTNLASTDVLLLIGHGTTHSSHTVYNKLNETLRIKGIKNIFIGILKDTSIIDTITDYLKEMQPQSIFLAPFMMVAGYHFSHDINHQSDDSLEQKLCTLGYSVTSIKKGLGEYPSIQNLIIKRIKQ